MTTPIQRQRVADLYAAVAKQLNGFTPREQQKDMVRQVSKIFDKEIVGLIDAPTGTGKTFGYLIPGIIMALTTDKVLVVSTATTPLQDQLAQNDMPILMKAPSSSNGLPITWPQDEAPAMLKALFSEMILAL